MTKTLRTIIFASGLLFNTMLQAVTIDFTEVYDTSVTTYEPLVGDEWADYGINTSDAYWYADTQDPFDGVGIANNTTAGGEITFLSAVDLVTVDWVAITASKIIIDVFDAANNLLDSFSYNITDPLVRSGTTTLSGTGISSLVFHDGGQTVAISTLTYASVPEPSTLALMSIGLLGIGLSRKRRQKNVT